MLSAMEQNLREDNEVTARKLRTMLNEKFVDFPDVSLAMIKRFATINYFLYFALHTVCAKVSQGNWMDLYTAPLLSIHQGSKQN